jgi:hypothetical protein
MSATA